MQGVVSFGEILLRLKTPGHERFFQSSTIEAAFGGSESNVASILAQFGQESAFVTAVPDNAVGDAVVSELRKYNVNTSFMKRRPGRLGIYFLETGAYQRPSNIIYDRTGSCISCAAPSDFNWSEIFQGTRWFYISGIMPAVSENTGNICIDALKAAKKAGLIYGFLNYTDKRKTLNFAAATACLKHTIPGDVPFLSKEEVELLVENNCPGRLHR